MRHAITRGDNTIALQHATYLVGLEQETQATIERQEKEKE